MNTTNKFIFFAITVCTLFLIWTPDYPPMVDIPQHAAQISIFLDIIKNQSNWSDLFEINLITPYWIGYGPWILLSLIFSVTVAFKIIISFFFIAYLAASSALIDKFNAPKKLKVLVIPIFFGFSYEWGLFTFLAAVPLGIFFFIQSINTSKNLTIKNIIYSTLLGLILFSSHILVFIFFCLISYIQSILILKTSKKINIKKILTFTTPYFIYLAITIKYILITDPLSNLYSYGENYFIYSSGGNRILEYITYPWSGNTQANEYNKIITYLLAITSPFIIGLKPSKDLKKYTPLIVCTILWFTLPHFISNTFLIYQRYSIFTFIFYLLIFEKNHKQETSSSKDAFLVITTLLLLYNPAANLFFFSKDTNDFKKTLDLTSTGKRALSLVFSPGSLTVKNPVVYIHFPLWYQAEKSGLVDFNFAWFNPQIVRYKPEKVPEVRPSFEWTPGEYQRIKKCEIYDYMFVRSLVPIEEKKITIASCRYTLKNPQFGSWYLYEKSHL